MRECGKTGLAGRVLDYCKDLRKSGIAIKALKIHGNQYTESGTPDIHITCLGRSFWVELKVGDNQPKKIQQQRLKEWAESGAEVCVAYSVDDVRNLLRAVFPEVVP